MLQEKFRYFIELQGQTVDNLPRNREIELRRQMAESFVGTLQEWLDENALRQKVSTISITAFGQILITCERDVIKQIREQDLMQIAAIRQSAMLGEALGLLAEIGVR